jgi:RHS repeat-associated protein
MLYAYDVLFEGTGSLRVAETPPGAVLRGHRLEWIPAEIGASPFRLILEDEAGRTASQSFTVEVSATPAEMFAPPLDPNTPYTFNDAFGFMYQGPGAPQQGVQSGAISPERFALVHGRILDRSGAPLMGVRASIKGQPELGFTETSSVGRFILAINGGGSSVVRLEHPGHLTAEREVRALWNTHVSIGEVVLVRRSETATRVELGASVQIARGEVERDEDGERRATLLFSAGTVAEGIRSDGTVIPLQQLTVRATEFTVGASGPRAMPADLPATSGYTYAVDLSADEAPHVRFSKPVVFYVENFLGFPTGGRVPIGVYDEASSRWQPQPDGRIIAILGQRDGLALLDTDGDGLEDNGATLQITEDERAQLAQLYLQPATLWRSQIEHFSTWDCNWPFGPPPGAQGPPSDLPPPDDPSSDDPCQKSGSIIDCDQGNLRKSLPLSGTGFHLVYSAHRMPGAKALIDIPLSNTAPPPGIQSIIVELEIGGRTFREAFMPTQDLVYRFEWDGRDVFGRELYGPVPLTGRFGYSYRPIYYRPDQMRVLSFGSAPGGATIEGATRQSVTIIDARAVLWRPLPPLMIQKNVPALYELGGWRLDADHRLAGPALEMGDGRREESHSANLIELAAGAFDPAHPAYIPGHATYGQIAGITTLADGRIYVLTCNGNRNNLYAVFKDAAPELILEGGAPITLGDGTELARGRQFSCVRSRLHTDSADRILVIFEQYLLRFNPANRTVEHLAGNGEIEDATTFAAPRALSAKETALPITGVFAVGPNDEMTIASHLASTLFDLVDGRWLPRAGFRQDCDLLSGPEAEDCRTAETTAFDGRSAVGAYFTIIQDIDYSDDGTLYIVDYAGDTGTEIRAIDPDGLVRRVAGRAYDVFARDPRWNPLYVPIPATEVTLGGMVGGLRVAPNGTIYLVHHMRLPDGNYSAPFIHAFRRDDVLVWLLGRATPDLVPEDFLDPDARIQSGFRELVLGQSDVLAFDPRGDLLFVGSQDGAHSVWRARLDGIPGLSITTAVLSPDEHSRLIFNRQGRIIEKKSAFSGRLERSFFYDAAGLLTAVESGDGERTEIARAGDTITVTGPYGHTTTLTTGADGYLSGARDPLSRVWSIDYHDGGGLLKSFTDPKGHKTEYTFADGRLTEVHQPNGGVQRLVHERLYGGFKSTWTSAEGVSETFQTIAGPAAKTKTVTHANGRISKRVTSGNQHNLQLPGGSSVTVLMRGRRGGEPLGEALSTLDLTLPSGRTASFSASRSSTGNEALETLAQRFGVAGREAHVLYDAAARTLRVTSPEGRVSSTILDERERVVELRHAGLEPSTLEYDERGRVFRVSQGSRSTSIVYDASGNVSELVDALGRRRTRYYDAIDRLTLETLPGGQAIQYAYDLNNHLRELTPPGREAHQFRTDEQAGRLEYEPPAVASVQTLYTTQLDLDRRLRSSTLPSGEILTLLRDAAGRPQIINFPEGTLKLEYDQFSGRPSAIDAPNGVRTEFTWDGPLLLEERTIGAVSGFVQWEYDESFQLDRETVGAETIEHDFDRDGLLTRAGPLSIEYRTGEVAEHIEAIQGVRTERVYNRFGELTSLVATWNGAPRYAITLETDALGRITSEADTLGERARLREYSYHLNGELHEVLENSAIHELYTYDDNSNANAVLREGEMFVPTYNEQDQLTSYGGSSFSYDTQGRLERRIDAAGSWDYTYDTQGNLLRVIAPDQSTIEYSVDSANRRITRSAGGARTNGYLYRGAQLIAELDSQNAVRSRFVYGVQGHVPSAMVRGGVWYAFLTDSRGSMRAVLNTTTGAFEQTMAYDAFGRVLEDSNPGFQPFGFAGGLYDAATGLVRFGARDYDASVARWTAKDPLGFAAGDPSLYVYAFNDPINLIDTTGEAAFLCPALAGALLAYRIASGVLTLLDAIDAIKTLLDPCVSVDEKIGVLSLLFGKMAVSLIAGKMFTETAKWLKRFLKAKACFVAGTMVWASVAGGADLAPIESLAPGDVVAAIDASTGEVGWEKVSTVYEREVAGFLDLRLVSDDGRSEHLGVTHEHPFLLENGGFVAAGHLRPGDRIYRDGVQLTVAGAAEVDDFQTVYNLEVDNRHTYAVGELGAWVHNGCLEDAAADGRRVWTATDDGVVLPPNTDIDVVPTKIPNLRNPQWKQVHSSHPHRADPRAHAHGPEPGTGRRVDAPLADTMRQIDDGLQSGELRMRSSRGDRGGP